MALTARAQWKEMLFITDEEGRTLQFECGWGVDPPVAYIPSAEQWPYWVPHWLEERRDEVIQAMAKEGHVVKEVDYPPS
jgi:hypothetical protein